MINKIIGEEFHLLSFDPRGVTGQPQRPVAIPMMHCELNRLSRARGISSMKLARCSLRLRTKQKLVRIRWVSMDST